MNEKRITPETILADDTDHVQVNDLIIRKGTIAAFISNIRVLENTDSTQSMIKQADEMLLELAPAIIALELDQHITFKNARAEEIIQVTAKNLRRR